jgi:integrase
VRCLFLCRSVGARLIAILLYGGGLRLMECLRLHIQDIDFSSGQIILRDGKGNKDRLTMLPESANVPLQEHLDLQHAVLC